ncbi:39S ribosomal protein L32, mitochondrial [Phlebotomus papatasi]|uniref:39S ribosomal protein L32, mitochondrial n=1 Tax=Phlebotomus papatasi TaxID=29031 RepID=UPI0024845D7E|nr:39S ribosomal protein L32, mitochondrial [Phlebotomus papatasi]
MLIRVFSATIRAIENAIFPQFPRQFPGLAVAGFDDRFQPKIGAWESLKNTLEDAILWAVPKHRRTIERRLKRKFGSPQYKMKTLQPKHNLKICITCGHHHEVGVLCPHCYSRVKAETEAMQEEIQKELGLQPIDKDVIVLYEGEKLQGAPETWQGKRIVELKRPRPAWFSKNLLEKTTQPPATTKEVKPTDLG